MSFVHCVTLLDSCLEDEALSCEKAGAGGGKLEEKGAGEGENRIRERLCHTEYL